MILSPYLRPQFLLQRMREPAHDPLNLLVGQCLFQILQNKAYRIRFFALRYLVAFVDIEKIDALQYFPFCF